MDAAIGNIFAPILDKLARQDSGDGMLFRILKEITGKYSIQQTRAIKQPDPQSRPNNPSNDQNIQNIFTEFKKLYRDILRDQSYKNDYKLFLKKILDRDLLESAGKKEQLDLIPGVDKPLLVVIDGLTKKGAEDFKDKLFKDLFKDLNVSLSEAIKKGFTSIKKDEKGLIEELLETIPDFSFGVPGFGGGGRDRRRRRAPRKKTPTRPSPGRRPGRGRVPIPPILPGAAPKPAPVPKGAPPLPAPKPAPVPKGTPPLPKGIPKGGRMFGGLASLGIYSIIDSLLGISTEGTEGYIKNKQEEFTKDIDPTSASDLGWTFLKGLMDPIGMVSGGIYGPLAELYVQSVELEGQNRLLNQQQQALERRAKKLQAAKKAGITGKTAEEMLENFDAKLYGFSSLDEFRKARMEGKLDPSKMKNYEDFLTNNTIKINPGATMSQNPPLSLKEGGLVMPQNNKPTLASIAEPGNPEVVVPVDRLFKEFQTSLNTDSLNEIAGNTKDTNKALGALAEAIVKMVTVFNQKMTTQGGTTIINSGRSQQTTSASMAANLNSDPIRRVRSQFMS